MPTKYTTICEVHFSQNMWEKQRVDDKKKLKFNAVPALFEKLNVGHTFDVQNLINNISEVKPSSESDDNCDEIIERHENVEVSSQGVSIADRGDLKEHLQKLEQLLLKSERLRMQANKKLRAAKTKLKRLEKQA
ncbi:THAP domain-containing protein 1 B-like isoform X2 [Odontomachus brunneus]|uniref:THAP domain-containing protein 1 B-like isoform X2 n=1 Tax=Odontomachus brunneus TaxID=486640 RepID=UPI0013F1FD37|nr:THAP domain-containing protein 1 B-like isoform X2 [Odontomachus brunneus]